MSNYSYEQMIRQSNFSFAEGQALGREEGRLFATYKALRALEDVKAEIEKKYEQSHYDDGLADALNIIEQKIAEVKGDKE